MLAIIEGNLPMARALLAHPKIEINLVDKVRKLVVIEVSKLYDASNVYSEWILCVEIRCKGHVGKYAKYFIKIIRH
jgi:hypothetical protein